MRKMAKQTSASAAEQSVRCASWCGATTSCAPATEQVSRAMQEQAAAAGQVAKAAVQMRGIVQQTATSMNEQARGDASSSPRPAKTTSAIQRMRWADEQRRGAAEVAKAMERRARARR